MDRQSVMDYLRMVGVLEWDRQNMERDIEALDNERMGLRTKRTHDKQRFKSVSFYITSIFAALLISVATGVFIAIFWSHIFGNFLTKHFSYLDDLPASEQVVPGIIINVIYAIPIAVIAIAFFILLLKMWVIGDVKYLIDFRKNEKLRIKNAPSRDAELVEEENCLINLYNKYGYHLQQVYDMDILHSKYQNFHAVSTMFEYFQAGSVDTLKEALNKYDNETRLDDIRDKLGEINEANNRIYNEMLYQTQLAEENNRLAHQQLEYSKQIAKNTDFIAANTRQIAENTELTALNTGLMLLIQEREAFYKGY